MNNLDNLIYEFFCNPLFIYSFYCFFFSLLKDKKFIFHSEANDLEFQSFNKGLRWSSILGFVYLIFWFIKYRLVR